MDSLLLSKIYNLNDLLSGRERERERRARVLFHWFTLQTPTAANCGTGQNQEPEAKTWVSYLGARDLAIQGIPTASQDAQWWESGVQVNQCMTRMFYSHFTHDTTPLPPSGFFFSTELLLQKVAQTEHFALCISSNSSIPTL